MRRKLLILAVMAGLVVSLAAAGTCQALQIVDGKKIMVLGGRQPAPDIDPSHKTDYSRRMLQQAFYDALYKYVGNPAKQEPWLATKYEVTPDAKVWTFHLVKNAKFHNGDPLTAEAVKYSYVRTLTLKQGPSWMLAGILKPEGIKVLDDYTIQFTLEKPYAPFFAVLPWFYVMNPKQVKAHEKDGDYGQAWLKDHEAGSGPYTMGRWEHGVLYEMKAVNDYWKGWLNKNHPDSIFYKLIRETNTIKIGLRKGQLDFAVGLSSDDYDLVKSYPGIVVTNDPGITTFGLKMNTQKGYTKDINIRKALCYAIDYPSFLKVVNGKAILEDSPFPKGIKGYTAGKPYRQDLAKAKEYMKKAGYPNGGFELEYVYVQGLDSEKNVGLMLIDNLGKIGIKVKMIPLTWPNMTGRGSKVDSSPALMAIFATPKYDDPDAVAYQYHKGSWGKYYGSSFYKNEEVWNMIDKARTLSKMEERQPLYDKIQQMIMKDAPEIFGMQVNRQFAHRDYIKGFTFCPLRLTGEVDVYPLYIEK